MNITLPPEEIETERLILKRLEIDMADEIFAAVDKDRARLNRFLPWVEWMKSGADEMKYITMARKAWVAGEILDYAIYRKSDRRYLGNFGGHHIAWRDRRIELGYWVIGEVEGQGYVTEFVKKMGEEFFKLGFNRIEIRCDPRNLRSAAIPKKLGYVFEATLRQNVFIEGAYLDTSVYAKLAKEQQ